MRADSTGRLRWETSWGRRLSYTTNSWRRRRHWRTFCHIGPASPTTSSYCSPAIPTTSPGNSSYSTSSQFNVSLKMFTNMPPVHPKQIVWHIRIFLIWCCRVTTLCEISRPPMQCFTHSLCESCSLWVDFDYDCKVSIVYTVLLLQYIFITFDWILTNEINSMAAVSISTRPTVGNQLVSAGG